VRGEQETKGYGAPHRHDSGRRPWAPRPDLGARERGEPCRGRGRSIVRLLRERVRERGGETSGQVRPRRAQRAHQRGPIGLERGRPAAERLERDRGETVEIGPPVHPPARGLLGRHITGRADRGPGLCQ